MAVLAAASYSGDSGQQMISLEMESDMMTQTNAKEPNMKRLTNMFGDAHAHTHKSPTTIATNRQSYIEGR